MVDINGVSISLGGYLTSVLEDMKEFPKHDWDVINLVTGDEGDGKTTFVKLCSYYLDPKIKADQWAYNSEQFEKIVDMDFPVGSNIVWDESDELSGHWSNVVLQTLTRKFKRIRKKRYVIWLVTPTFFDMRMYFAIKRTRCLFDVYAEPTRNEDGKFIPNRGRVRFFNKNDKRLLYIKGKKEWNMHAKAPSFFDRFGMIPSNYPIDADVLEAKKDEAMKSLLKVDETDRTTVARNRAMYVANFNQWFLSNYGKKPSGKDFNFIFKISDRQALRDLRNYDKNFAEKLGTSPFTADRGDTLLGNSLREDFFKETEGDGI